MSDVTLTKCEQSLPLSTQIRKRPRDHTNKQRDWPEKRHKTIPLTNNIVPLKDSSPTKAGNWSQTELKIEEKNPEALAKKIIEQGRNLEKSKSTDAIGILSPRSINNVCHATPKTGAVEVRKVETIDNHYNKSNKQSHNIQQSSIINATSLHRKSQNSHIQGHNRDPSAGCNLSLATEKSPTGSMLVDLPKVDLKLSMNNASSDPIANSIAAAMCSAARHDPSLPHSHKEPPLVLPPHPNSRSHSSEGHTGEDLTFASTKGINLLQLYTPSH